MIACLICHTTSVVNEHWYLKPRSWDITVLNTSNILLIIGIGVFNFGVLSNWEVKLGQHIGGFVGRNIATKNGVGAIKVLDDLLKRRVAGLDVVDVDDDELEGHPDGVDHVVLPFECGHGNRVNVAVEEQS